MDTGGYDPVRVLVFEASLRGQSLNGRLASLAAAVVEQNGGTVDRAHMSDFDCPSYEQDIEDTEGFPAEPRSFAGGFGRQTPL